MNKRVKNAVKCEEDGIKFDSRLERYMYIQLRDLGITFKMQVVIELIPPFRYEGKAIRPMKIIPDFYLEDHNTYVDTKGFALPEAKLKYKLLKYHFHNALPLEEQPKIVILKNQKEVTEYLTSLIQPS